MQKLTDSLTVEQVAYYHAHGFLHIPSVFPASELACMRKDLDWMIREWANIGVGWTGPWRKALMDIETEAKSKLIAMHDLQFYADSWMQAVTRKNLSTIVSQLLADADAGEIQAPVELHHSTMHVKPSETGHPFPMHQDLAFYDHVDNRYVDVLVHLDDTRHENGEIRFVEGSHKLGRLEHTTSFINDNGEREPCTPHLPWGDFSLDNTVPVSAKAGDVVVFNILTIHGSHINQTNEMRRLVRVGYKHPDNHQTGGSLAVVLTCWYMVAVLAVKAKCFTVQSVMVSLIFMMIKRHLRSSCNLFRFPCIASIMTHQICFWPYTFKMNLVTSGVDKHVTRQYTCQRMCRVLKR